MTADDYIEAFPPHIKNILVEMRRVIHLKVPTAVDTIRYGIPTFQLNQENLVHFATIKNYIGLYPTSSGVKAFAKELAPYKTSKGAIQFPLQKPIPYDLVTRIVEFQVREVLSK